MPNPVLASLAQKIITTPGLINDSDPTPKFPGVKIPHTDDLKPLMFPTIDLDKVKNNGYGVSRDAALISPQHYKEELAWAQGWGATMANGLARIGNGILFETLKIPGYFGGFDNAYLKALNEMQQTINEEYIPVHIKQSVENGGFLDKVGSAEWWASTGADGAAFFLSMMIPGNLIAKTGLGAFTASQLAKGLSKIGGGRLVAGYDDVLRLAKEGKTPFIMSADANKAVLQAEMMAARQAGNTARAATLEAALVRMGNLDDAVFATQHFKRSTAGFMSATINTFAEAAAEASNTRENVLADVKAQNPFMSDEEAALIAGERASQVFNQNIGLLLTSNLLDEAWIWKSFSTKTANNSYVRKALTELKEAGWDVAKLPAKSKSILKALEPSAKGLLKGIIKEGAFEEGTQFEIEHEASNLDIEASHGNFFPGVLSTIFPMLENVRDFASLDFFTGDVHKQEAVFLGGLLGGGASAVGEHTTASNERKAIYGGTYQDDFLSKLRGLKPKTTTGIINELASNFSVEADFNKTIGTHIDELRSKGYITKKGIIKDEGIRILGNDLAKKAQMYLSYATALQQGDNVLAAKLEERLWTHQLLSIAKYEGGADVMENVIEDIYLPKFIEQYRILNEGQQPSEKVIKDLKDKLNHLGNNSVVAYQTISEAHKTDYLKAATTEEKEWLKEFDGDLFNMKLNSHLDYMSTVTQELEIDSLLQEAGLPKDFLDESQRYLYLSTPKPLLEAPYKKVVDKNTGRTKWLGRDIEITKDKDGKEVKKTVWKPVRVRQENESPGVTLDSLSESPLGLDRNDYGAKVKWIEDELAKIELQNETIKRENENVEGINKANLKHRANFEALIKKGFARHLFTHGFAERMASKMMEEADKSIREVHERLIEELVEGRMVEIENAVGRENLIAVLKHNGKKEEDLKKELEAEFEALYGLQKGTELFTWRAVLKASTEAYRKTFIDYNDPITVAQKWEDFKKSKVAKVEEEAKIKAGQQPVDNSERWFNEVIKRAHELGYKGFEKDFPVGARVFFYNVNEETKDEYGNTLPAPLAVITRNKDGKYTIWEANSTGKDRKYMELTWHTYEALVNRGFEMIDAEEADKIRTKLRTYKSNLSLLTSLIKKGRALSEQFELWENRRVALNQAYQQAKINLDEYQDFAESINNRIKELEGQVETNKGKKGVKELRKLLAEEKKLHEQVKSEIELLNQIVQSNIEQIQLFNETYILNNEYLNFYAEKIEEIRSLITSDKFQQNTVTGLFESEKEKIVKAISEYYGTTEVDVLNELAINSKTKASLLTSIKRINEWRDEIQKGIEEVEAENEAIERRMEVILAMDSALSSLFTTSSPIVDQYGEQQNALETSVQNILADNLTRDEMDEVIDFFLADMSPRMIYGHLNEKGWFKESRSKDVQFDRLQAIRKIKESIKQTPQNKSALEGYRELQRNLEKIKELERQQMILDKGRELNILDRMLKDMYAIEAEDEFIPSIEEDLTNDELMEALDQMDYYKSDEPRKTTFLDFERDVNTGRNKLKAVLDVMSNSETEVMLPIPTNRSQLVYSQFMAKYNPEAKENKGDYLTMVSFAHLKKTAASNDAYKKLLQQIESTVPIADRDRILRDDSLFFVLTKENGTFTKQGEYFITSAIPDNLIKDNGAERIVSIPIKLIGYIGQREKDFKLVSYSEQIVIEVKNDSAKSKLLELGFQERADGKLESQKFEQDEQPLRDFTLLQLADITYQKERNELAAKGISKAYITAVSSGFPTLVKDKNGNPVLNPVITSLGKKIRVENGRLKGGRIGVSTTAQPGSYNSVSKQTVTYRRGIAYLVLDDGTHVPLTARDINKSEAEFITEVLINYVWSPESVVWYTDSKGEKKTISIYPSNANQRVSVISSLIHFGKHKEGKDDAAYLKRDGIWLRESEDKTERTVLISSKINPFTLEKSNKRELHAINLFNPEHKQALTNYLMTRRRRVPKNIGEKMSAEKIKNEDGTQSQIDNRFTNFKMEKGKVVRAGVTTYAEAFLLGGDPVLQTHIIRPDAQFPGEMFSDKFAGEEVEIPQWQGRYFVWESNEPAKPKPQPKAEAKAEAKPKAKAEPSTEIGSAVQGQLDAESKEPNEPEVPEGFTITNREPDFSKIVGGVHGRISKPPPGSVSNAEEGTNTGTEESTDTGSVSNTDGNAACPT